jgi:hypothetical protein
VTAAGYPGHQYQSNMMMIILHAASLAEIESKKNHCFAV